MQFDVYAYERIAANTLGGAKNVHYARETGMVLYQLAIELSGGAVQLQPGAMQYVRGAVQMETVGGGGGVGGFLRRAVTSAGTGESSFRNRFSGHGTIWTEPTFQHLVVATLDSPADALLLDDRAFYAAEDSIKVEAHVNRNIAQGMLGGEGLIQPKISGQGAFVLESPVPASELDIIDLHNDQLILDGDLALAFSASLEFRIEKSQRGVLNTHRSGEGLVHVFRGTGQVWVMPTMGLAQRFESPVQNVFVTNPTTR